VLIFVITKRRESARFCVFQTITHQNPSRICPVDILYFQKGILIIKNIVIFYTFLGSLRVRICTSLGIMDHIMDIVSCGNFLAVGCRFCRGSKFALFGCTEESPLHRAACDIGGDNGLADRTLCIVLLSTEVSMNYEPLKHAWTP